MRKKSTCALNFAKRRSIFSKINVSFLGLCIAAPMLLTGCHGSNDRASFEIPQDFDTSKNYEITFWAKNDTNKAQTNIYNKAIEDFEALYPNIDVTIRLYTDYGKIYNDVITNISTGTTPNVCITYPDHIATYLTGQDIVVPLDDLMADAKYGLGGSEVLFDAPTSDEMIDKYMEECKIGGVTYALPYMRSTEACYINKTYVEKMGYEIPEVLTWDFVWEVSEAALTKDADGNYAVNGQKTMIPFIYKSTDNMMISMLKQLGAGYSTDDGTIEIFNDDTRNILKTVAEHAGTGAFSTFAISSYPANFLAAGQCIFAIDSTAGSTWMGSEAPLSDISEENFVDFETAVLPIPQYDTTDIKMISQGPSICVFNKEDSGEVLASWLFAQFLLTNDVQIAYSETEGYIPVTTKAQESAEYQDYLSREGEDNDTYYEVKLKATKLLLANISNTFVTPVFNGSTSLRNAAGTMIENVTKAKRRKKTVDDAFIDALYDEVYSLYHLDQTSSASGAVVKDLGPLPTESKVLIIVLIVIWVLLGARYIHKRFFEKNIV
ncbi:MAG: extracellular solute-binding protein [Butyrivibrio sp.]|nr:extracellular solute-binding protein [Butyrivibrio sp.]